MFTGLAEALASVQDRTDRTFTVERPKEFDDLAIGSSVCVSGACLSVAQCDASSMVFNVVPETWKCTTLGSCRRGDIVNLERAMKINDRFEGHIVQGHVEGVGIVKRAEFVAQHEGMIVVEVPQALMSAVIPKGSIAVDGIALTVAAIEGNDVTIALIPHTMKNTTVGLRSAGDRVNIETDMFIRAVRHFHSSL